MSCTCNEQPYEYIYKAEGIKGPWPLLGEICNKVPKDKKQKQTVATA